MIGSIPLTDDPPLAGDERTTLLAFLDYFRCVLIRKASGLTADQLATTLDPSTLTLGGLVHHLAFVEDYWFTYTLLGEPSPEPWASADWKASPDWEFDTAGDHTPTQLLTQFDASVARSRQAIDRVTDLDQLAATEPRRGPTSLRWILVHMVEEYARHVGHADLIRESIDGQVDD